MTNWSHRFGRVTVLFFRLLLKETVILLSTIIIIFHPSLNGGVHTCNFSGSLCSFHDFQIVNMCTDGLLVEKIWWFELMMMLARRLGEAPGYAPGPWGPPSPPSPLSCCFHVTPPWKAQIFAELRGRWFAVSNFPLVPRFGDIWAEEPPNFARWWPALSSPCMIRRFLC